MNIKNALIDLDNSWSREIILEKIKEGQSTDKIVNEFIKSNKNNLELVSLYIEKNRGNLFEDIEKLSICELKLINELKSLQHKNNKIIKEETYSKELKNNFKKLNFALFFERWSNSFVIYILILISLVSLTKQAWAL
tara:strand:- start:612 stop:1022 length:411 start_codon:yes stop_codon:yes gene_type:complete